MKAHKTVGVVVIAAGVVWTIAFPKTSDLLRPGFVGSVALGVGLIATGTLTMIANRQRLVPVALTILMLWSLLLNAYLAATVHRWNVMRSDQARFAREHARILDSNPQILESHRQFMESTQETKR